MTAGEVEEAMTMISDCYNRDHKLSAWEADFLESIKDQLIDRGSLSEKQLSVLNTIWDKVTG